MNTAKRDPSRSAYILAGSNERVSYGELEHSSNQIAHLFRDLGLTKGDSIAICLENHASFLTICWAAQRTGLYYTPISYRLQPEEVEYIVNDCGAKVLITSLAMAETFSGLHGKLVNSPVCLMLDGEQSGATSLEAAIAGKPVYPVSDEANGGFLLYSSGTTGKHKRCKTGTTRHSLG